VKGSLAVQLIHAASWVLVNAQDQSSLLPLCLMMAYTEINRIAMILA